MPSHEQKLFNTQTSSDNDLRREIRATGMLVVGAWVRKSRYGDGITFGCFLLSLLFSSSLLIGFRPSTNGVGMGFYHLPLEVEFPRAPNPPKGRPEWYRSVAGLMISYKYVRGMIV